MKNIRIEVCANSVQSAIEAQKGGAYRIELCDNLYEGGTTPSVANIKLARKHISIKLNVIIRPRGSDFVYSDLEFEVMKVDIQMAKDFGADGVVTGILKPDGTIDKKRTSALVDIAKPLTVTFHRAFDMTKNLDHSLTQLIDIGVDCILTSGGANKAVDGIENIAQLVEMAKNRISIMAGSGINENNIASIIEKTKAPEYHLTGSEWIKSKMIYRKENIFMGGLQHIPEFEYKQTSAKRIQNVVEQCKSKQL